MKRSGCVMILSLVARHLRVALLLAGLAALAPTPVSAAVDDVSPQPGPGPGPLARLIEGAQAAGRPFRAVDLLRVRGRADAEQAVTRTALRDGLVLALDKRGLRALLKDEANDIRLALPGLDGKTVELELTKVNLFAPGFAVFTSDSPGEAFTPDPALHYRGVVKGEPASLAAISVFPDEVMGIYRTPAQGTVVLGKVTPDDGTGDHVLYAEKDLLAPNPFACHTGNGALDLFASDAGSASAACVRIYVEADYNLFTNKGSVQGVVDYVTGLFNQSAVLFQNEGVPISVSEIFVWTTPSPYTGQDSFTLLSQFQSTRTSFNGDLGHLVSLNGFAGGIAAGFSGFCAANRADSQCFSGIEPSYANVPTYSWSVYVITHEMGHLMGSRHTHACVWNGNNTAIDGCAGFTEEEPPGGPACPLPGYPSGGGTIMSYCHQPGRPGIDFNLGFGPQPGDRIRGQFAAAGCLGGCGGGGVNGATFETQSVPTTMVAGESYAVSVRMRNSGTTTWTSSDFYRLGSQNPQDNRTWGIGRVELPVASVAPGASTSFTFTVTAPAAPGTHNFQWRVLRENVEWFGDFSPNVAVTVAARADNAAFVSQSVPSRMVPGQSYPVSVTMRNTGNTAWRRDRLYRLGTQNPPNNQTWGPTRVELPVASVAPGATVTFDFTVTAPSTAGTYNFQWRMVRELVLWFGDFTPNLAVSVTRYEGFHDGADCTNIRGWAWDRTLPNTPIDVDIFGGSTLLARVSANRFRQDLLNAGIGNGYHAFVFTTPESVKNGQTHAIRVAIAANGQNLGGTPRSITCGNRPPTPQPDSAAAHSGRAVTIDVTANDSDPDGDPVTLTASPIVVPPGSGSAVRVSGSSIQYTSLAGFTGNDPFQYEVTDGKGGLGRAWVTVSVTNNPPVAVDDSATIHVNTAVSVAVTANDYDPDGDPVTLIASPVIVPPTNGMAAKVNGSTIQYTPNAGFQGNDSFQYEIGDGQGKRARAWVTVSVTNNPPVARDDTASTPKNVAVTIDVTANDYDPDGDPVTLISNPVIVAPTKGTAVKVSGSSIKYAPNTGVTGTDRFQYEIGDGQGKRARAWVTVTITP
jgi:hypothetical protein